MSGFPEHLRQQFPQGQNAEPATPEPHRCSATSEREGLVIFLKGRRRDALRACLASVGGGADYWRWQGHAELARQVLEQMGEDVPKVVDGRVQG